MEIGQTELKHTSAQWNPMWLFMVLGCCQAKQNKTEKADFGQPQQKCNSLIGAKQENGLWVLGKIKREVHIKDGKHEPI